MSEEKKNPSVMIATPMYGGMCTGHYVEGLLKTTAKMRAANIPVFWAQIMNESLIPRARNELARVFLEGNCDYFMFIDADIGFGGDDVMRLLAADKDVVCGLYPKKEVNWDQVRKAAKEGKEDIQDYGGSFVVNFIGSQDAETDADGVVEVRHGGTGFMLIKREVFESLKPFVATYHNDVLDTAGTFKPDLMHEFFPVMVEDSRLLSEDFAFCTIARKQGYNIYAAPWVRLGHYGSYLFEGSLIPAP